MLPVDLAIAGDGLQLQRLGRRMIQFRIGRNSLNFQFGQLPGQCERQVLVGQMEIDAGLDKLHVQRVTLHAPAEGIVRGAFLFHQDGIALACHHCYQALNPGDFDLFNAIRRYRAAADGVALRLTVANCTLADGQSGAPRLVYGAHGQRGHVLGKPRPAMALLFCLGPSGEARLPELFHLADLRYRLLVGVGL